MKCLKFILPLALIGILISPMIVGANFGVDIGDTFTYDCVTSELSISIGSKSASVTGYAVDGHDFAVGTSVVVEVLEFDDTFFNTTIYEVQAGSYAENGSSSTFGFVLSSIFMMFYPMLFIGGFVNETSFNQTEAEETPMLFMLPFVEVDPATWTGFANIANELQTGTSLIVSQASNMTIAAEYSDSVSEFIFEMRITGNYNGNVTDGSSILFVDYEVDHHFQFSYQKLTGVMNGMQLEGTLTGTSNSTALSLEYHQKTELEGYNLPNYELGGGTFSFPGFGILGAVLAVGSLFAIAIIIRRRK
ncbi:MAG TPA: choice-of-anchor S family protein [candidate division Zixibacteria bacterium]|nr:choice-of-anchor S family protein [candidate division Zixibacteria bacterium]